MKGFEIFNYGYSSAIVLLFSDMFHHEKNEHGRFISYGTDIAILAGEDTKVFSKGQLGTRETSSSATDHVSWRKMIIEISSFDLGISRPFYRRHLVFSFSFISNSSLFFLSLYLSL